ncbi:RnfABCDGE type electron transport complex subunit G [Pantoea sp. Ap-967]|uniref:RnfABCDGE type electron transport complex subunit G n=1 Tax=Pantoea sp. Ap-967 TaxID=2608362 RepID=UPI00141EEC40|nr:RnfABCDGE type electron transport complex subunit G [Pantoea sp. Ap-967]NIE78226.1 RnfABCDGE type electron transport complex subunit G [Pantoea sp. Ap-967]
MTRQLRSGLLLALIGALALAATLAWRGWTHTAISDAERQLQARQLLAVLPAHSYDNQPLDTPLQLPAEQPAHSRINAAYRALLGTSVTAVVLVSQVQGYAAPITLVIAIAADGRLVGTQVIEQRETPGLGGRLDDPQANWLAQFAQRSLTDRWAIRRDHGDFDQLAGATVTSRAVIEAQHEALAYFDRHRLQWLRVPAHE